MLSDLNLEEKKSRPPSFSELLLLVRTEEDRQAGKATRMKKHLSIHRQRAMASSQSTCVCSQQTAFHPESGPLTELKQQVASLQSQLTTLMSEKAKKSPKSKLSAEQRQSCPTASKPDPRALSWKPTTVRTNAQPRPWYCFKWMRMDTFPLSSSLPGGLLVKPCLVDLPCKQQGKLPVVICNQSDHDVIIPPKSVIAELSAIHPVPQTNHNKII